MHFRSKYRSERTKNRTAAATRKEAAATWYGRLVFAYAIWQFVALMLEYSAPAFVFESSRLLNVTNIPSYPSIVSFLLLTLIALGLLRRQRPALWMSVILWQGLSLVLSAVAGILIFLYPRLGGKTVAVGGPADSHRLDDPRHTVHHPRDMDAQRLPCAPGARGLAQSRRHHRLRSHRIGSLRILRSRVFDHRADSPTQRNQLERLRRPRIVTVRSAFSQHDRRLSLGGDRLRDNIRSDVDRGHRRLPSSGSA